MYQLRSLAAEELKRLLVARKQRCQQLLIALVGHPLQAGVQNGNTALLLL